MQHVRETKMAEGEVLDIPDLPIRLKLYVRLPPSLRMTIRFGLSTLVGVFVTLFLFYVMQALIQSSEKVLKEDVLGNLVDFVRVKQEPKLERRQRKLKKPPPPDEPPPNLPPQNFNISIDNTGFSMQQMDISVSADIFGGGFGISDGDYLPIVKVQAQYPRRALTRRMTGWVILEFTVTEQGMVSNLLVAENCGRVLDPRRPTECVDSPNSIFDSAATKAALKFKYKPKVMNGKPVATAGVRHKIIFELPAVA